MEERAQNSDSPVVRFGFATVRSTGGRVVDVRVYAVLLADSQGGRDLMMPFICSYRNKNERWLRRGREVSTSTSKHSVVQTNVSHNC